MKKSFKERLFSVLFHSGKASKENASIAKVAKGYVSLSDFLEGYELQSRKSLGRKYRTRESVHLILRPLRIFPWKKCVTFLGVLAFRSFAVLLIAAIVYGVTPGVLSAPKSVGITTYEEWNKGDVSSLDRSDPNGAIQLQSDGTWNKRVWGVPQEGYLNGGFGS
ncbi:MAG: hypothetical protein HGA31_04995, partial [Candidatus Moranbacteria bacterium]|nr:hypothetical protein [Candidatus Moranbacteria bacterium]